MKRKPLGGFVWGVICGIGGGIVAGFVTAAFMIVGEVLLEDGSIELTVEAALDVVTWVVSFGSVIGAFFGGVPGALFGLLYGLNRHEVAAPKTGAIVASFVPLLAAIVAFFHPESSLVAALLLFLLGAMLGGIGFVTGIVFQNRLRSTDEFVSAVETEQSRSHSVND